MFVENATPVMPTNDTSWQDRIRELYANVEDLYAHVDVTIAVFDAALAVDLGNRADEPALRELLPGLTELARRVIAGGAPVQDVALDATGRRRAHGYPVRATGGAVCVIEDDAARRELFVRCALAIFDGYRQNEADLLERERDALHEAKRANRQRDQFLATVSHELRAPLAAIRLWEEVLRNAAVDDGIRGQALDAIRDSADAQSVLVGDLLDVSRAINGKLFVELLPVDIERVVLSAIERSRPASRAKSIAIAIHLDPDLGSVIGDVRRLHQIFDNLLSNAIKCTERGTVSVRAQADAGMVVIEVRDTGRGIEPAFLPHVFEPFRQDGELETRDGLGLGLAIARELVELHGGTLLAQSEGAGRGAAFTIRLPRLLETGMPSGQGAVAAIDLAGVHALVVDDDPHVLGALQLLLRRAGAVVTTARAAGDAFALLVLGEIGVLVSDIAMPVEDGCSLIKRVRATAALHGLPAIAITARASEAERDAVLAAGFDRCLAKPIDMDDLIATMAALVATRADRASPAASE